MPNNFNEEDVKKVVEFIDQTLMNMNNESIINAVRKDVNDFMKRFELYENAAYPAMPA